MMPSEGAGAAERCEARASQPTRRTARDEPELSFLSVAARAHADRERGWRHKRAVAAKKRRPTGAARASGKHEHSVSLRCIALGSYGEMLGTQITEGSCIARGPLGRCEEGIGS